MSMITQLLGEPVKPLEFHGEHINFILVLISVHSQVGIVGDELNVRALRKDIVLVVGRLAEGRGCCQADT